MKYISRLNFSDFPHSFVKSKKKNLRPRIYTHYWTQTLARVICNVIIRENRPDPVIIYLKTNVLENLNYTLYNTYKFSTAVQFSKKNFSIRDVLRTLYEWGHIFECRRGTSGLE